MNNPDVEAVERLVNEYTLFRLLCYLSEVCRERAASEPDARKCQQWNEAAHEVEECAKAIHV